jgi:succinate dehydrogenase / fumarate reductase cytochrome b subunit
MSDSLPKSFVMRRLHSLFGLLFLLFLIEHLFTNSQAALWIGDSGKGFIDAVNFIHNLPYLNVIEVLLIGVPIAFHAAIGIKYALSSKMNSFSSDGSKPSLKQYGRNQAYSWQRITSYFLLFMIIFHVTKFRFVEYPKSAILGDNTHYLVKVSFDPGLYSLSERMNFSIYDNKKLEDEINTLPTKKEAMQDMESSKEYALTLKEYNPKSAHPLTLTQDKVFESNLRSQFETFSPLENDELVCDAKDFGTATILSVRNAFKNTLYCVLYTLFVAAAVFHGFNGFWTFLITWGLIFKRSAQMAMASFSIMLMFILGFLGLAAIWASYFITLKT